MHHALKDDLQDGGDNPLEQLLKTSFIQAVVMRFTTFSEAKAQSACPSGASWLSLSNALRRTTLATRSQCGWLRKCLPKAGAVKLRTLKGDQNIPRTGSTSTMLQHGSTKVYGDRGR